MKIIIGLKYGPCDGQCLEGIDDGGTDFLETASPEEASAIAIYRDTRCGQVGEQFYYAPSAREKKKFPIVKFAGHGADRDTVDFEYEQIVSLGYEITDRLEMDGEVFVQANFIGGTSELTIMNRSPSPKPR